MFTDISLTVLSIFLMMVPGYVAGRRRMLDENSLRKLSSLLVAFIYPCLIFSSIVGGFDFDELASLWFLPASCFGIMLLGFIAGGIFIPLMKTSGSGLKKSFHFQCTMNNYSFLPLPIAYALYADRGASAVILSSLGAELAVWTLGIGILTGYAFKKETLRNLLTPPLVSLYISLAIALILRIAGTDAVSFCSENIVMRLPVNAARAIAGATIPIAMVICGARMALLSPERIFKPGVFATVFLRLVAIPLAAIALLFLLPIDAVWFNILLIVAVMPTSAVSIVLGEIYGADNDFMASTFVATHVAGMLTIPVLLSIFLR